MKVTLSDGRSFKLTVDQGVTIDRVREEVAEAAGIGGRGVAIKLKGVVLDGAALLGDGTSGTVKLHRQKVDAVFG